MEVHILNILKKIFLGEFTRIISEKGQQFLLCRHTLPSKNSRIISEEVVVMLASPFMLSTLEKLEYLFMDDTFQTAPNGYYQTLILLGLSLDISLYNPITSAVVTSKTQEIYEVFLFVEYARCKK